MLIEDIHLGETEQLEFKETPNKDSLRWLKTVVAFANCRGGRIVFGITNDRRIIGLQGDVFAIRDSISDAVSSACYPVIPVDISMTAIDGKQLIVLEVQAGRQTPYYIKSQGDVEGVYVRYDATTHVADELSLKELRVSGTGHGFDSMECRELKVTEDDVAELCRKMCSSAQENARTEEQRKLIRPITLAQLVKWGVLLERNAQYLATNAYALLQGNDCFQSVVKCAIFKGTKRSVFVDRREFHGAVQELVEEAYKYVLSKINLGATFGKGVHREDVYEIPPSAIREIIVNAVVHRSYVNGEESPITVALYDDRLEVTSPGRLPHGVTVAKMLEGCSECRNTVLARAFSYMGLIEDWGSGIPRICDELQKAGLPELEISPWPNAVRIVIRRNTAKYVDIQGQKIDIADKKVDIHGQKVDIQAQKVDIAEKKVNIKDQKEKFLGNVQEKVSSRVFSHIVQMLTSLGGLPFFKRADVVCVLSMSATGASKLLLNLLALQIIVPVGGHGKGAYRFALDEH